MNRAAILVAPIFPAAPVLADICVANAGDVRMFFAAETDGGALLTRWLGPGGSDRPLRYGAFDRCLWHSHAN